METHADARQMTYRAIISALNQAQTIVICGHTCPDCDAIGSGLALKHTIERLWPHHQVWMTRADETELANTVHWLPGAQEILSVEDLVSELESNGIDAPDLFIAVDTPIADRLNLAAHLCSQATRTIKIDHHYAPTGWADIELVDVEAAATGLLVYDLIAQMPLRADLPMMDEDTALCILAAVTTDTGRFQYQNTSAHAHEVAASCIAHGASPSEVSLKVYQSVSYHEMSLRSRVMDRLQGTARGLIAYSYLRYQDYQECQVSKDKADAMIDIVRMVEGAELILMVKEERPNYCRINLRSKSNLSIREVAEQFGGGGHAAAAGYTLICPLDEAIDRSLAALKAHLYRAYPEIDPSYEDTAFENVTG